MSRLNKVLPLFLLSHLALCLHLSAQTTKPDITLQGTLTYADKETYKELPFDVPSNVTRISVDFSYTGHDQHTNLDLGILDTERFRGWSGGNKGSFTLSETDATPSYLPGAIPSGKWTLLIGVPNIEPGIQSHYEAKVSFEHRGDIPAVSTFSREPLRAAQAWYRGDLHMHDAHSDGACLSQSRKKIPCPLYKTVEDAAARKLDFLAISDHNTISHYNDERELQPYFDQLLLIPGREITTFEGHANVFGTTDFIDFRLTSPHVPDVNHILHETRDLHGLFSINHPGDPTGAACMGCGWSAPNTDYSLVGSIEAINGGAAEGPTSGIPFWQDKLNHGFRITAVGGSDNHNADIPVRPGSGIGRPTTVVFAQNLSERAILDGIRAGHVFIDADGSDDNTLELTATSANQTFMMGDAINAARGVHVMLSLKWQAPPNASTEWLMDGKPMSQTPDHQTANQEASQSFDYSSDGARHWIRANVRSADGRLLLLANPIYINF